MALPGPVTAATGAASRQALGRAVLLSQLYPPDIGGSAVLLHETYSRLTDIDVLVGTDAATHAASAPGGAPRIVPLPIATPRWGFVHPAAIRHHLRLAFAIRRLVPARGTVVHCARALPEGIAAWAARRLGGPRYVCWTHGEDVTSALLSRELTMTMTRVYAGASAVIANSRNTRTLLEGIGVPPGKIQVVYPGVDAGRFHPDVEGAAIRERLAPGGDPVILSVGRLQRRKGHDLAIAAVASLKARFPRMRYVIVGDGEERGRLEELVRSHDVSGHVVFAGEVPAGDLPACYAACDIFLLPNRIDNGDVEGFGIVFLEAAAAGRPSIGGRSGGVGEAVAEGVSGLLVSGTSAEELAGALARLANDPGLRHRLGTAGRQRVLRSFTWEAAARRTREIHAGVLGLSA
jgi:phosphatidylinositol alpha-1,6-mannosyltransferase